METKKQYVHPDLTVVDIRVDIITYSETDEWPGPEVDVSSVKGLEIN